MNLMYLLCMVTPFFFDDNKTFIALIKHSLYENYLVGLFLPA